MLAIKVHSATCNVNYSMSSAMAHHVFTASGLPSVVPTALLYPCCSNLAECYKSACCNADGVKHYNHDPTQVQLRYINLHGNKAAWMKVTVVPMRRLCSSLSFLSWHCFTGQPCSMKSFTLLTCPPSAALKRPVDLVRRHNAVPFTVLPFICIMPVMWYCSHFAI